MSTEGSEAAAPAGPADNLSRYRLRIMRALKDRDYVHVLAEHEAMVQAGVTPDVLSLNCILEAKALRDGIEDARQLLQARARVLIPPRDAVPCSRPVHASGWFARVLVLHLTEWWGVFNRVCSGATQLSSQAQAHTSRLCGRVPLK